MGKHVVSELTKTMKKKIKVKQSKILIMGLTFKENCSDIRNSGVQKLLRIRKIDCNIDLYDPWVKAEEIKEYKINPVLA